MFMIPSESKISEKQFEDILAANPVLIEDGLKLEGRQVTVHGRRMDLLFRDSFNRRLIVELKAGPVKDQHIGQILAYEGMLLTADDPSLRVMLIGNRVPPNIQKALDHHGIAWREISLPMLRNYMKERSPAPSITEIKLPVRETGKPALFVPIEGKWLARGMEVLKNQPKLFFATGAHIGAGQTLPITNVYFKIKGTHEISAKADFLEISMENPSEFRLPEAATNESKYYYGFKNLRGLASKVSLCDLVYYSTRSHLKNDVPGACIIIDPEVD